MRQPRHGIPRYPGRRTPSLLLVASVACFALLLAGCGGSSTTSARGTNAAEQGIADVCSQPMQVDAAVPDNIPGYPNAQLRISDVGNGSGEFGYCASASTSAVASFYMAQLPGKGWQNVKSVTFSGSTQVMASQGNEQLIETASTAAKNHSQTSILIIVNGM